jgi:hypothetical protein
LGELNGLAQSRWLKSIEVFNEQGESRQLKLFPADAAPVDDDGEFEKKRYVRPLHRAVISRTFQFGNRKSNSR